MCGRGAWLCDSLQENHNELQIYLSQVCIIIKSKEIASIRLWPHYYCVWSTEKCIYEHIIMQCAPVVFKLLNLLEFFCRFRITHFNEHGLRKVFNKIWNIRLISDEFLLSSKAFLIYLIIFSITKSYITHRNTIFIIRSVSEL